MKHVIEAINDLVNGLLSFAVNMLWSATSGAKTLVRFFLPTNESVESFDKKDLAAFIEALHKEEMKLNKKHQGVK